VRIARSELVARLGGFLEWDSVKCNGIDEHLAMVNPDTVLDAIGHVDDVGTAWR